MYPIKEWPSTPPVWEKELMDLLDGTINEPSDLNVKEFIENSKKFSIKFPIETVRCESLKSQLEEDALERNINSVYPVVHECVLNLFCKFILHKRKHGSEIEKSLYKEMSLLDLIQRLLVKRAVMFMGRFDNYLLLDGTKGSGKWETIGKAGEKSPLLLKNCLSYDEIKLSALLSVSSYTHFINNGSRKNKGIPRENRDKIQTDGVIVGVIGARMKRKGRMEYEELMVTQEQNTIKNGYGTKRNSLHGVFADFYQEPCFTYDQVKAIIDRNEDGGRFTKIVQDVFDNVAYGKRISISIDTLLLEANERGRNSNKMAFVHVVGLGLGVWKCSPHQEDVFMETFAKRLEFLGKSLDYVSDVFFAYFSQAKSCGKYKHKTLLPVEDHPNKGIKIFISKREPADKLLGEDAGKLLVVSYAWDGNALPGNEFWSGKLASSGDSAAASSTQISELHNPHINAKVCASNLKVATKDGLITFEQFRRRVFSIKKRRLDSTDSADI